MSSSIRKTKQAPCQTVFTEMYTLLNKHVEICMRPVLELPVIEFEHPVPHPVECLVSQLSQIDILNY